MEIEINRTQSKTGDVSFSFDWSGFNQKIKRAQFALDNQIIIDMEPLMPMQTGTFIKLTKARAIAQAGSGLICAAAPPFGRFLYYGKVMVDPETGSPFARKGVKKVVTDQDLKFWRPGAVPKWFEAAKKAKGEQWTQLIANCLK